MTMREHRIPSYGAERLAPFVGRRRVEELSVRLGVLAECLGGRRVVNLTGDDRRKGGVYEMMRTTLPYLRGGGVEVTWVDLPTRLEDRRALEFFHFLAHGTGRGADWRRELPARTAELRSFSRRAASELTSILRPSDLPVLHDTQAAPLVEDLTAWRDRLVWYAHVGTADRNPEVAAYWGAVEPSVAKARARVFHRHEFVPPELLAGLGCPAALALGPAQGHARGCARSGGRRRGSARARRVGRWANRAFRCREVRARGGAGGARRAWADGSLPSSHRRYRGVGIRGP